MKTSLRQAATPQHRSRPRRNNRQQRKTPSSGQHPRRRFLALATGALALPAVSRIARAQVYPTRPITMIVAFPAGAGGDAVGRILAERMRSSLGQPIVIENVGGADGSIGMGRAARTKADGYTIVLGLLETHVINGALYPLQYDVLKDFAPILPLVRTSYILTARKTMPGKDVPELIAWLKANPNKASAGISNGAVRLLMALFEKETATRFAFAAVVSIL